MILRDGLGGRIENPTISTVDKGAIFPCNPRARRGGGGGSLIPAPRNMPGARRRVQLAASKRAPTLLGASRQRYSRHIQGSSSAVTSLLPLGTTAAAVARSKHFAAGPQYNRAYRDAESCGAKRRRH